MNHTNTTAGRERSRFGQFCALAGCLVLSAPSALAQFTDWQSASGAWSNAANWSNGVPGSGLNKARIDNGGTAELSANGQSTGFGLTIGDFNSGSLIIKDGGDLLNSINPFFLPAEVIVASTTGSSGDVTIMGAGSQWTIASELYFGWGGAGVLNIDSGGRLDTDGLAYLGFGSTGSAVATIDGVSSLWEATGQVVIAQDGTADLTVQSGGAWSSSGSVFVGATSTGDGSITVTGAGSSWTSTGNVTLGSEGSGDLSVTAGADVDLSIGGLRAAKMSGSSAGVVLSGSASSLDTGALTLGENGTATLTADGGATLTSGAAILADASGSSANMQVSGVGTAWGAGSVTVGRIGNATLNVSDGAMVNSGAVKIGEGTTSDSSLTLAGAGTGWDAVGDFEVASSGAATFELNTGASSLVTGNASAGGASGSDGTVTVDGGTTQLQITGDLTLGDAGTGTLNLSNGGSGSATQAVTLGNASSGVGTLDVSGSDSIWTSGDVDAGVEGEGTLNVSSSGALSLGNLGLAILADGIGALSAASSATVSATGLEAGVQGQAQVNLSGGATMNVTGSSMLGGSSGSQGQVFVAGVGTILTTGALDIAQDGAGQLSISLGGRTNSLGDVRLGGGIGSVGLAEVADANSIWEVTGAIGVGENGDGTLTVRDGAVLTAHSSLNVASGAAATGAVSVLAADSRIDVTNDFDLAFTSGRPASLTVGGGTSYVGDSLLVGSGASVMLNSGELAVGELNRAAGSVFQWTSGTLSVHGPAGLGIGASGPLGSNLSVDQTVGQFLDVTGYLSIEPGAQLALTGSALAAGGVVNDGQIVFVGGTQTIGPNALLNQGAAQLTDVTIDGDYVNPGGATTSISGTVTFEGNLSGAGAFTGSGLILVNGGHQPGDSPARVEVEGDFQYASGSTATYELGGTTGGSEFDVLAVGGDVSLAGILNVSLINGFTLAPGMNFRIIETGGILTGQFDGLSEGATVGNFGGEDLFVTYGAGAGSDVALYTSSIPEPGSASLLLTAAVLLAVRRRRVR